jgi:hypothetical protein
MMTVHGWQGETVVNYPTIAMIDAAARMMGAQCPKCRLWYPGKEAQNTFNIIKHREWCLKEVSKK